MKCNCPKCRQTLTANRDSLKTLKHPVFRCPNCQSKIGINPSSGKCGNCGFIFKYFDFMFPKKGAIGKCPACRNKNKLIIKY